MSTVNAYVKPNSTLGSTVDVRVSGDDPDHHYDATITSYLNVGSRRVVRLPSFNVVDVNPTVQHYSLRVPKSAIERAVRYGAQTHHRRATLKFVMTNVVDTATGNKAWGTAQDSFVRLPRSPAESTTQASESSG